MSPPASEINPAPLVLLSTHPLRGCSLWHCPKVCLPRGTCKPWRRSYNWWRAPGPWWSAAESPYWRPPRTPSPLGLKEEWEEEVGGREGKSRGIKRKRKRMTEEKKATRQVTIKTNGFHFMIIGHFTVFIREAIYVIANLVWPWKPEWQLLLSELQGCSEEMEGVKRGSYKGCVKAFYCSQSRDSQP